MAAGEQGAEGIRECARLCGSVARMGTRNRNTTWEMMRKSMRKIPITLVTLLLFSSFSFTLVRGLPVSSSSNGGRVARIALLHMHDSVSFFRRLGKLTGENKARYAERHGYDMIWSTPLRTRGILKKVSCDSVHSVDEGGECFDEDVDFDIDHKRAPTFGKIKLTLASCVGRRNGWIFWSDADAMVINQTVRMETIIDDAYDMIYSVDWLMLNAGMLLMKCSEWSLGFLRTVYNARKFDKARALDQSALQAHIDNLSGAERRARIKIIPKYAMDVYTEEYVPGDFLMHFAGKLYEATEPGLFAIANQFDILSMVDEVEDIEAFFRGRRFLNYFSGTCNSTLGDKNLDCKPDDPRRILLNESLGSMSVPNRYRHVGLRYYWLGNWKDLYDTSDWDAFKQPLKVPEARPAAERRRMEGEQFRDEDVPLGEEERKEVDIDSDSDSNAGAGGVGGGKRVGGGGKGGADELDVGFEEDGDPMAGDEREAKQMLKHVDGDADDDAGKKEDGGGGGKGEGEGGKEENDGLVLEKNDDDDDDDEGRWKKWVGLAAGVVLIGGVIVTVKRRRKKYSKTQ